MLTTETLARFPLALDSLTLTKKMGKRKLIPNNFIVLFHFLMTFFTGGRQRKPRPVFKKQKKSSVTRTVIGLK
jgi:hypothetical protein